MEIVPLAMFTASRTDANEDLTGYTATNEVTDSGGIYSAGGKALTSVTIGLTDNSSSVPTAFLDFADTTWASSTISNARVAVVINLLVLEILLFNILLMMQITQ